MNSEYDRIVASLNRVKGATKLFNMYFNILFCHYHDEDHIPNNDYHSHLFFELHIILDGKCQQNFKVDHFATYEKDEFWIIYPGIVHQRNKICDKSYREICIAFEWFTIENNEKINVFPPLKNEHFSHGYITHRIADLINKILQDSVYGSDTATQKIYLQMHLLITEFLDLIHKNNDEYIPYNDNISNNRLQNICMFISDNLQNPINSSDVSAMFNLSTRQLDRIFESNFQRTLSSYIKLQKINFSKKLLEMTTLPIKDVGLRVGFNSAHAFSRFFESYVSVTPSKYRKEHKSDTEETNYYTISRSDNE